MAEVEQGQPATIAEHITSLFNQPDEGEEAKKVALTTTGSQAEPGEEEVEEEVEHEPTEEEIEAQAQDQQTFISLQDRIARGRLREIDRLRERDQRRRQEIAQQNERMGKLEKELADLRGTVAPEYDKELIASDPTLSYFTKRLESLGEKIDAATKPPVHPEGYIPPEEMQEAGAYAAESRKEFVAHTPDWNEAYGWLRDHYAGRYGLQPGAEREQVLNVQEVMAVRFWMENGQDPASEIYSRAVEEGWRPGMRPARAKSNGSPTPDTPRIRRVKEVIGSPSLSGIRGERATSGRMSAKEFYSRYNHAERQKIFQDPRAGNEIHEQLDGGSVDRHLLPQGGR
jgi:hypothetical protein